MAEVGLAHPAAEPRRRLVVKRVLPHLAHDEAFVASLRVEADVLMRLRHENIVELLGFEESGADRLLLLEYVDGCDLRALADRCAAVAPPPPGLAAYVVQKVCRALAHAHRFTLPDGTEQQILHRDVSPSNVMLARDGRVKLVDFGIARMLTVADEATRTRSIRGKLGYMAPEQLSGGPLTPQTDVYGAGVVLHEALTGRQLFRVTNPEAVLMVRSLPLTPPSVSNRAVPPELDEICLRALAFAPEGRFADARELERALDPIVERLGFGAAELGRMMARLVPESETVVETVTAALGAPARRRRSALAALLLAGGLLGVAAWPLRAHRRQSGRAQPDAPTVRPAAPTVQPPAPTMPAVIAPASPSPSPETAAPPPRNSERARPKAKRVVHDRAPDPAADLRDGKLAPF